MTFVYPVIMTKRKDGSWEGEFPDLKMCRCEGSTLFDALEDAREQMYNWIDLELHEEEPVMPHVSDAGDLHLKEGQEVRSIMVHYRYTEGWDE
ncbi:MAG TPA: HicB family protein [Lachnospiraceae bacterium]|jgi:predicted RNase H-like HicB family nuclease|nr:HicB family protein [Lachnospiraceae bacterium]